MYVGLNLTYASSFQMFRGEFIQYPNMQIFATSKTINNIIKIQLESHPILGSVIIFVALLSVGFLDRKLVTREWTGILFVIIGLGVVGLSDFVSNSDQRGAYSRNNVITGDLLIITAQIITAVQMVYEERFVAGMDIPALQGIFFFIHIIEYNISFKNFGVLDSVAKIEGAENRFLNQIRSKILV